MKKKIIIGASSLVVLIGLGFGYLLSGIGAFRSLEPKGGEVITELEIYGPEDLEISFADSFAIISSTERKEYPPKEEESGDLYYLDLRDPSDLSPINLTSELKFKFAPHGISMIKMDSLYLLKVINHTSEGHSIEVFEFWDPDSLVHVNTLSDPSMIAPNDLVQIDAERFYFTNDKINEGGFGQFKEEFLGIGYSNVIYFDGESYREVSSGIAFANGINYLKEKQLMLIASSRGFQTHVFSMEKNGDLKVTEVIDCNMGVDNIMIDENQDAWLAGHPNLMIYPEYAQRKREISPSEVVKLSFDQAGKASTRSVLVNEGQLISGSTVACPFNGMLLIGSALDDKLVIVEN